MKRVMDRVELFSESMLLHYAAPNKDIVTEILQFDAECLTLLTPERRAKYVMVLGQYLVMLQHNENLKNIEFRLATKAYEHSLALEKFAREDIKAKSEKDRNILVLAQTPALQEMHDAALVAEAEKMSIEGMVRAIENLLNALKKDMSFSRVAE